MQNKINMGVEKRKKDKNKMQLLDADTWTVSHRVALTAKILKPRTRQRGKKSWTSIIRQQRLHIHILRWWLSNPDDQQESQPARRCRTTPLSNLNKAASCVHFGLGLKNQGVTLVGYNLNILLWLFTSPLQCTREKKKRKGKRQSGRA